MKITKPLIFHPFLLAAFPILFMYAHNMGELPFSVVIIPLGVVLSITLLLYLLLKLISKNNQKTAILLSFALTLFFSYGPVSSYMKVFHLYIGDFIIGRNKAYLIIGGILFCFGAYFIIKTRKHLTNLTKVMNVIALSLILFSFGSIGMDKFTSRRVLSDYRCNIHEKANKIIPVKAAELPNIYYIILDAYGSKDVLSKIYDYDNTEFINYLKQKGFYIAEKSKANYQGTFLSLASSLNLSYLDPADGFQWEKYRDNKVFSYMKRHGYTTIFISSLDADVRICNVDFNLRLSWLNNFDYMVINLTPIPELMSRLPFNLSSYSQHREKINYTFDNIAETAAWPSPVFVFAHIFAPHPPFVFGPNGENIQPNRRYSTNDAAIFFTEGGTRAEYIKGYRGQIEYLNKRLMKLISHILSGKGKSSVIVLQGDHGPRLMTDLSNPDKISFKESYAILNAYHLPGNGNRALYESITPVNTFRLVLNLYFGENLNLLEDRSYLYNFDSSPAVIDVTSKTKD